MLQNIIKNLLRALAFSGLLAILLLSSCKKDHFNLNKLTSSDWNPNLAIPILNTTLDVYNVLSREDSSELVVIDPATRLLALVYRGEIFSFSAGDIVSLPDGSMDQDVSLNATQIAAFQSAGKVTSQYNPLYTYSPAQGVKITKATLISGQLEFKINSTFQHSGTLRIILPTIKKNGVVFETTIPHEYTGSPIQIARTFDLAGYEVDMSNGGTNVNQIPSNYIIYLENSGNPTTTNDKITITQSYKYLNYATVYGYFGRQDIARDKDSILIKIFAKAVKGHFRLVNPKLTLITTNSFGFPINITFDSLFTYGISSGEKMPITFSTFPNPFAINHPNQPYQSTLTNLVIDKSNSSIIDLITPTPKYLVYKIHATSNPSGPTSTQNFITDQSRFNIKTELELPLEGYAHGFNFIDTVAYSFGDNIEEIESILLRLNFENGFPFSLDAQLYLADEHYNIMDSLLVANQNFISAGPTNAEGRVEQSAKKITDILLDSKKLPAFFRTRYIIVKAVTESFQGKQEKTSRIYDYYKLNVKVGMQVQAKINLN